MPPHFPNLPSPIPITSHPNPGGLAFLSNTHQTWLKTEEVEENRGPRYPTI